MDHPALQIIFISYRTQSNEEKRNKTMQGAERKSHAPGETVGDSNGQVQRHQPYYREVDLKAQKTCLKACSKWHRQQDGKPIQWSCGGEMVIAAVK